MSYTNMNTEYRRISSPLVTPTPPDADQRIEAGLKRIGQLCDQRVAEKRKAKEDAKGDNFWWKEEK